MTYLNLQIYMVKVRNCKSLCFRFVKSIDIYANSGNICFER